MRRIAKSTALVATALAIQSVSGAAGAAVDTPRLADDESTCQAELAPAAPVETARSLRFGVTATAQIHGPTRPRVAEDPAKTFAALRALNKTAPVVARVHRLLYGDPGASLARAVSEARRYARAGIPVSLQLRYGKSGALVGSPEGFPGWVTKVVERAARFDNVVSVEVMNEPNLTDAPEASDGFYEGHLDALVAGVVAADGAARKVGSDVLVGFTWFHHAGPVREEEFWGALASAPDDFRKALGFIGLDAYPGTWDFPKYLPLTPVGLEGRRTVDALHMLRCYMTFAGIAPAVPIMVTESSYPNGPGRTEQLQVDAMRRMVEAVHSYSGDYNVTDYWWFTLRDVDSTGTNQGMHYGLLNDDYSPKPAFHAYEELIADLSS